MTPARERIATRLKEVSDETPYAPSSGPVFIKLQRADYEQVLRALLLAMTDIEALKDDIRGETTKTPIYIRLSNTLSAIERMMM